MGAPDLEGAVAALRRDYADLSARLTAAGADLMRIRQEGNAVMLELLDGILACVRELDAGRTPAARDALERVAATVDRGRRVLGGAMGQSLH
jgi:hypothetical protein